MQRPHIQDVVRRFCDAGLDGVIAGDLELIAWCHTKLPDLKIVASTTARIMNPGAAEFFKALGVRRITLPACLTFDEMADLVAQGPDMEYECFITNEDCININGLCRLCHLPETPGGFTSPCKRATKYSVRASGSKFRAQAHERLSRLHEAKPQGCFLCRLFDLKQSGINFVKIPGREGLRHGRGQKAGLIAFVKYLIRQAGACTSGAAFAELVQEHMRENTGHNCPRQLPLQADVRPNPWKHISFAQLLAPQFRS